MLWKDEQSLFLGQGDSDALEGRAVSVPGGGGIQMLWKDEQFLFLEEGDSDALEG